ncbi:MAG: hypothetical protein JSW07_04465 [bacterium]|nr:MAG: hypothetical protein JSW07_04465 [bacterium]
MEYIFPKISIMVYSGIGTIILGALLLLGIAWGRKGPLGYILGSIVCIIIGIFLLRIANGGTLKIEEQAVRLKIPLYSQKVITFDQITDRQIVSLDSDSPFKPAKRKSGTSTEKFKSGWFLLKNREKAFLLLEGRKAIYVKTTDGNAYLIGINDFDQLLENFQQYLAK